MTDHVILVDNNDNELGYEEKMKAHQNAQLHRAFSIVIINSKKEMLLQQRAAHKYHSGGLWSNACCSHPRPEESLEQAAHRRLVEEMGFDCELEEIHHFIYYAELDNDLKEHEYDHVLLGSYDGDVTANPEEVQDYKWMSVRNLVLDMENKPSLYTEWFKILMQNLKHTDLFK